MTTHESGLFKLWIIEGICGLVCLSHHVWCRPSIVGVNTCINRVCRGGCYTHLGWTLVSTACVWRMLHTSWGNTYINRVCHGGCYTHLGGTLVSTVCVVEDATDIWGNTCINKMCHRGCYRHLREHLLQQDVSQRMLQTFGGTLVSTKCVTEDAQINRNLFICNILMESPFQFLQVPYEIIVLPHDGSKGNIQVRIF